MQRKIQELWPGFMRRIPSMSSQAAATDHEQEADEPPQDSDQTDEFDEEQLLEDYKNLYWT